MDRRTKLIWAGVLAAVALVSIFLLGNIASAPETYTDLIATLDEKKANVMGLMGTTTAASIAVSALPGDTGSAVAEKLVDLSSYFLIILSVIYLEKFLVTILGYTAFTFLVPAACVLFAVALFMQDDSLAKGNLRRLASKFVMMAAALALIVPASVWATDAVDKSFDESLAAANEATAQATAVIEGESQDASTGQSATDLEGGDVIGDIFGGVASGIQEGIATITQGAQDALNEMGNSLNQIVDTLAVMIATSCLIPIIVLAVFLWLMKTVAGLDFGGTAMVFGRARSAGQSLARSVLPNRRD